MTIQHSPEETTPYYQTHYFIGMWDEYLEDYACFLGMAMRCRQATAADVDAFYTIIQRCPVELRTYYRHVFVQASHE